jgi:hypothetical protein
MKLRILEEARALQPRIQEAACFLLLEETPVPGSVLTVRMATPSRIAPAVCLPPPLPSPIFLGQGTGDPQTSQPQ